MKGKTAVSKEMLFAVLTLLDGLDIRYWVDGGWGVDILIGKQNRGHRDIDINFDGQYTEALLESLYRAGYQITTDWRPVRLELYHPQLGYLDVHPLVINQDGSAKQAALLWGWYRFRAEWFTSTVFEGRTIACLSAQAQKTFHRGYRQRDVDRIDMKNLNTYLENMAEK